ncbi:MAG: 2-oxoacid:ferredoxin oxidoreductase subunit beta [Rikenellaceae bacterium]
MENTQYTAADFKSNQEVKWCPGCGDHAILNSVAKAMSQVAQIQNRKHEEFAVISGIGCSSRFPYYVNIYGFHSIHGRAAAIASGVKAANPNLSIWQVSGDGDALAIGGNHFIHAVRRNIDINIMLFNNEIYGLTKGQYSPTSEFGKKTKTSPYGTIEQPFRPGDLILGARGTFFARSIDVEMPLTEECLIASAEHKGASVTEILQNCVIFNDGTFAGFAGTKALREQNTIVLRHGEKMIYGKDKNKGLMLKDMELVAVEIGKDGVSEDDILVHDAHSKSPFIHSLLINMHYPEMPVALGVIRDVEGDSYDSLMTAQVEQVKASSKIKCMDDLLNSGDTWEI